MKINEFNKGWLVGVISSIIGLFIAMVFIK